MNILFLSTWYPYPPDNGSKLRVYHLLRSLAARHRVTLLSLTFGTADPVVGNTILMDFCAEVQTVAQSPFECSAVARALRFFSPVPVVNRTIPAMHYQVTRALARCSYDVVIASTKGMASYTRSAPFHAIRVLEEHNSLSRQMWERYQQEKEPVQRLRCWVSWQKTRRYEASVLRRHHLVTMVSEEDRNACLLLLRNDTGHVEVVPNGVDCAHNRPGLAQPRPGRLVFNGSLTYSANYDAMRWFLAEVYPRVKAQVPGVTLTITGSTSGVDLANLALDDSVTLTGFVEDVRIPVAEASVAVAPIRQGGGTRLKILEAMALGTPVVATAKGAEGLDVVADEHLLLADDPIAFAAQVVRLLLDPPLQLRLSQQARQLVEQKYDWEEIGRTFVRLIEDTVAEHREQALQRTLRGFHD